MPRFFFYTMYFNNKNISNSLYDIPKYLFMNPGLCEYNDRSMYLLCVSRNRLKNLYCIAENVFSRFLFFFLRSVCSKFYSNPVLSIKRHFQKGQFIDVHFSEWKRFDYCFAGFIRTICRRKLQKHYAIQIFTFPQTAFVLCT